MKGHWKSTIILLAVLLLAAVPFGVYFGVFHGGLSEDHIRWAEFGAFAGGIYGTLAFFALAYTAHITRRQFKIQNEDNVFFKLYESLQKRIDRASAFSENLGDNSAILPTLANAFYERLLDETPRIARLLLARSPATVANVHYMKIFEAVRGPEFLESFQKDQREFISAIEREPNFNAKWERLKFLLGSVGEETAAVREALRAAGSVNFYKIAFLERRECYRRAVGMVYTEYGELLDGYLRTIRYLLEFVRGTSNSLLYLEFIKSQLTRYELIILFYLVAGRDDQSGNLGPLREAGILDGLRNLGCRALMLDFPTAEIVENEIKSVFAEMNSQ